MKGACRKVGKQDREPQRGRIGDIESRGREDEGADKPGDSFVDAFVGDGTACHREPFITFYDDSVTTET
jgi:hypothetical protein